MAAQLVVVAGPDQGMIIALTEGRPIQIGRGSQADVVVNDPFVSRVHCRVTLRGGRVLVNDLSSAGGTYVNAQTISSDYPIGPNDDFQIGETHFRLRAIVATNMATIAPPMAEALPEAIPEAIPEGIPEPIPDAIPEGIAVALPEAEPESSTVDIRKPNRDARPPAWRTAVHGEPNPQPQGRRSYPPTVVESSGGKKSDGDLPGASLPNLPSERLAELTGHTLAHYAVGAVIGIGQSGLVFRALDLNKDRDIALKVLWPESTRDDGEVQRFVRSMKTALPLRHPNVVPVLGAGRKKPYCYIAMEYIAGESLTQMLQRLGVAGRLDWKHVYRIGYQLARALAFAHSQHVIHRNLTPQNVLIRASDKSALLGDLYLAKALEGGLAANLTRPGEILGDIRYMAPERLEGHTHVDERSDLFSLGTLLYTLLAGHPPFDGASLFDIILKVRTHEPESLKKFQMGVADNFNGVVMRLLAKRPVDRYQTAGELLTDLKRMAKFLGVTL